MDVVPTFKTGNGRICLLLKTGQLGALRTEDAERLQVQHSNTPEASACFQSLPRAERDILARLRRLICMLRLMKDQYITTCIMHDELCAVEIGRALTRGTRCPASLYAPRALPSMGTRPSRRQRWSAER